MSVVKKSEHMLIIGDSWGDIPEWAYPSVQAILESLRLVDPETYEHCLRVGHYSRLLAKSAGLNEYQQKISEFAGMLHDVGKMGISAAIIHKPGKLNDLEYQRMKDHPVLSEEIIKPLAQLHDFFKLVLPAVRGHHERVDGKGYPDKLAGEEIPLISRVILIVDTLDAMSQTRAYRKGMSLDLIYKEIEKFAGTQFDKQLARIFLQSHSSWKNDSFDQETLHKVIKKVA